MGSSTWLASREDVATALDSGLSIRDVGALDRFIASSTDVITQQSGYPAFSPRVTTSYLPWPATDDVSDWRPWRLYLGRDIFASITSVALGASLTAVAEGVGGWTAYPRNRRPDEPIRWLELDRSGNASWSTGSTRSQDQVTVTGVSGWSDVQRAVGALSGSVNSTVTTLDLASAGSLRGVGVGNQLLCGNERMIVVDRESVDTGENLAAALDAYESSTIRSSLTVASGAAYARGETISIDEEDMLIERVRGNVLYVRRGWNGTTLADHAISADIYASRRLVVERGAEGSTAASHSASAEVTRWVEPPALHSLCIALAIDASAQAGAVYSRVSGTRDSEQASKGTGLAAEWRNAAAYMRKGRVFAV